MRSFLWLAAATAWTVMGCRKPEDAGAVTSATTDGGETTMRDAATDAGARLVVTTPAFFPGQKIPLDHTCEGRDVNPEVQWSGAPKEAKSFVLIVDDPDAPVGTFTHWVVFDMKAPMNTIPENTGAVGNVAKNDFGNAKWNGPCPPKGKEHRYFFKLFALDVLELGLPDGTTRAQVELKMDGHVLAKGETMGTFVR